MEPSRRARETQASPIRKLIPFADRAKSEGREVLHLNIGQPDIETPPEALEALRSYREKVLAYSPSDGYRSLKHRIVAYLGTCGMDLGPEEVNVTVGGSEAVLFALAAVTDPGDSVVIPEPFYANYKSFCAMLGVRVVPVTTSFENGFHLADPAALEEKIDGRTRAVLLCNPGNPTGTVYTEDEVRAVADIALRRDLFIISDEVYREFRFDRVPFFSPMHIPRAADRVIVTDSVSKRYSSCGARIGFVASKNREIMGAVLKFAMARLSPPSLEQVIAEREFSLDPAYFGPVIAEYQARRDILYEELSAGGALVPSRPEGAFYMMVKLQGLDSEDFARFLLTDFSLDGETVMVAPAPGFYATGGLGSSEIRLAYVLNTDKTRRAARILREGAEAYRGALREGSGLLHTREP
ncbi:MAG: pyridoxal phosphate-dependent aminotransferase [Spirochaetota bacterium]